MDYTPMEDLDRLIAESGGWESEDEDYQPADDDPAYSDARSEKEIREGRIRELTDQGLTWDQIAARTGYADSTVRVAQSRLRLVESRLTKKRRRASLARHTYGTHSHGRRGGRPRKKIRCACGEMTRDRAKARYHRCNLLSFVSMEVCKS